MTKRGDTREKELRERLESLEYRQRGQEHAADASIAWEVSRVRIPADGALAQSEAYLSRLYAGDLVPREKKPQVIDTRRSWGPYLVSIDDAPMVVLDACSQIATLTHGFAHPGIVRAIYEGRFDGSLWANPDTRSRDCPELRQYADALIERAPAGLEYAAFVGAGGAEANEKALRIARQQVALRRGGTAPKRVLAFEDSFHGRTWASLMATWNPLKRGPFELPGYETVFSKPDLESLAATLEARGNEVYAMLVEPMMAEGGDVHLSREFVLGVRELATRYGIPLIADEVQTGFATGAPDFFWWQRLGLGDRPETSPDLLTSAKKAGLGVVLSRWPDPEPTSVNVVSALRGLIQCEMAHEQGNLEAWLRTRVDKLAADHPGVFENERVAGTTFAFDLNDAAARDAFIGQRFQRGFMTYHAGERTIRFRLNASYSERSLDDLFARIGVALEHLDRADAKIWVPEGAVRARDPDLAIFEIEEGDWPEVMAIEEAAYEPERSDSQESLRSSADAGVGLVAKDAKTGKILGFCMGGRLEQFKDVSGPDMDPYQGQGEGFYSADVTVCPTARGRGVGRRLKEAQLDWARAQGLRWCTGRNRVGATTEMFALNRSLGAYVERRLTAQYGGAAEADYYRIPLEGPRLPAVSPDPLDLASGLQAPFGPAPEHMRQRDLVGPASSRLNLSNWTTPDVVHFAEHMREILPRGMSHLYFTTSRDELVDKALRCLKISRPAARVAVGFEGGFLGCVTAAARSLSDPSGFGEGLSLFEWPRLPHPADDLAVCLAGLEAIVADQGAEAILGVVIETVGERSGLCLEGEAAIKLAATCKAHDLPLVLVESAGGGYRGGTGAWSLDALSEEVAPDLVLWYAGGQLGQVFVNDRYYVSKPLTLISTWDGDEVSVIRTHEGLRAAWRLDLAPIVRALNSLLVDVAGLLAGRARVGGRGLYRTLTFVDSAAADAFSQRCGDEGVTLGRGLPTTVTLAPRLDVALEEIRGPMRKALRAAALGVMAT